MHIDSGINQGYTRIVPSVYQCTVVFSSHLLFLYSSRDFHAIHFLAYNIILYTMYFLIFYNTVHFQDGMCFTHS